MAAFKTYFLFVLLVLASAFDHPHSYSAADYEVDDENGHQNKQFPTFHVHIVNQLSNNETLYLHCKSQEEGDKVIQNLSVGQQLSFHSKGSSWDSNLFFCYSREDNVHAAFYAFWDDETLSRACLNRNCFWVANEQGIFLKNDRDHQQGDFFWHNWQPGW
ncbi:hypothetical protein CRYUN_Cryun18bG0123000 [Craigia yunnanensis]